MLVIALDFDLSLAARGEPLRWRRGAKEALLAFAAAGHRLILHTCRATPLAVGPFDEDRARDRFWAAGDIPADLEDDWARFEEMRAFLRVEGVLDLLEIWQAPGKPLADVMVDDRAEEPDWLVLIREFGARRGQTAGAA